jgi:1,4-dihydroxy-6-naphthoate synthase
MRDDGFEGILRFGHSPDPDDAFMFHGFAMGAVHVELPAKEVAGPAARPRRWRVEHLLEDIQSLNERALLGELEITAISAHAYPFVASKYRVMRTGVSMGDGYGPILVTRQPATLDSLRGARIAVPGLMTTAILALKIFLPDFDPVLVRFDEIPAAVRDGQVEAGLVIHEGQLTFEVDGLVKVADMGVLWKEKTGLPLPLGLDVVRRDLGPELGAACSTALRRSIEYARAHSDAAMAYALQYGRGLTTELGSRFVGMYVNDWTLDMGETGRRALAALLDHAAVLGLAPRVDDLSLC